ncbi:MAG TPA: DUF3943 domain-containing protein [Terriglobales bacterium]|nr:DUF3943 domain-containing protein [Terriglobales bacterium]
MRKSLPIVLGACLAAAALGSVPLEARTGGTETSPEWAWGEPPLAPRPALRPKTWRALLEEGVLWSASTIDYWGAYGKFTVDWQFTWKTFGRKFFTNESPRMDSNAFWYNWSHAGAGAGYYWMARANGLDSRWSFLFSFVTSAVWESLTEWRELISINDMTFTPLGGPAIGEPLFQVSSYFSHRPGFWNALAGFVFCPFLAVNNWFDHGSGPAANSAPDPAWHRFAVYAGLREDRVSPAGTTAVDMSGAWYRQINFGFDMETDAGPAGAGRAGGFNPETLSGRAALDASVSSAGLEEIQIRTSAVLFGGSWSSAAPGADGATRGGSVSVGYGTAFELFKKRSVVWYDGIKEVETGLATVGNARFDRPSPARFTDKLALVSPAGAVLTLGRFGPRFEARWTTSVFGDFAMVNSLPYNRYTETGDTSGVKTTLHDWGYYYALGMTLATDAAVDWRQWHFRGGASYQWYDSIQGLDRYQYLGLVTDDFRLRDTRLVWRFSLGYRLRGTPLELGLAAEGIGRRGRLLDLGEQYTEYRYFYQLRVVF